MAEHRYQCVPTSPSSDDEEDYELLPRIATNLVPPPELKFPASPSPLGSLEAFPRTPAKRRADRRQMRLNTELIRAIVDGKFGETKRCLKKGASPNATCKPARISCCHIASFKGDKAILTLLLEKEARLGSRDAMGRTPLHLAAWEGNPDCVKLLLTHAPDLVNVKTEEVAVKDKIPLGWMDCWEHDHRAVIDMLPVLRRGSSPLHVACKRTELICARHLLEAGADLEATDSRGLRPLDVVGENLFENCEEGDLEIRYPGLIRALIDAGAQHYRSPDYDRTGYLVTPLHIAVLLESTEVIDILLRAGFPRNVWDERGETPMHLCILKKLAEPLKHLVDTANDENPKDYLDPLNSRGMTPLHLAVEEKWEPGVSIVLEAGADVTVVSRDGYTALHLAAASGNVDVLREILSIPDAKPIAEAAPTPVTGRHSFLARKNMEVIDMEGSSPAAFKLRTHPCELTETPLFCAISGGNVECVEELLNSGCSLETKLIGGVTVFHRAVQQGNGEILRVLARKDEVMTRSLIDLRDDLDDSGMAPLHIAAKEGYVECVRILVEYGATVTVVTSNAPFCASTALHLAAKADHVKVVEELLRVAPPSIVEVRDCLGWTALHVACYQCSRDSIMSLVGRGADLSAPTTDPDGKRCTAIDFLVTSVPRPVEFLESVFDSCIAVNECNVNDVNCVITMNYEVLAPLNRRSQQMQVINALVNTGNRYGEKRLLIHPLVESFLFLKWRTLSSIFMGILALYAVFVAATTQLVTGIYYYADKGSEPPVILDRTINSFVLLFSVVPIAVQEILHVTQRSWDYVRELESWVKCGSIVLSVVVVFHSHSSNEWMRHVAAVAVLLAWTELMYLLSRFPRWGYYVLMFSKVATNVVKVLLTFVFLVIGFTFSFLVQFRGEPPFGSPWQSFVKTMVMMTSEFEYASLFDDQENQVVSMTLGRVVFVAFLVLAAIVLMNLMVGLAVNDINDLEIRGKTQRLLKQVNFLCTLDVLIYNEITLRCLPTRWRTRVDRGRFVDTVLRVYPGRPARTLFKALPTVMKNDIIVYAFAKRRANEEPTMSDLIARLDTLERTIRSIEQRRAPIVEAIVTNLKDRVRRNAAKSNDERRASNSGIDRS